MPHIHNQPNQHDMTISMYIIRKVDNNWLCLVHFHKKIGKYMQIGGHIELDETPWQSVAHELEEESGYNLTQLKVAQHTSEIVVDLDYISHPTPFSMNTHNVNDGHFHSDLCYGFLADGLPENKPHEGESSDLVWMRLDEMKLSAGRGETLADVHSIYKFFIDNFDTYQLVPADSFSLEKPNKPSATYNYGKPGQN